VHRPSLLVRFAVLSLVLVVALGAVLSWRLSRIIEHRNVASATANVTLAVDLVAGIQAPKQSNVATASDVGALNAMLGSLKRTAHFVGVDAYLPNGTITFSDVQSAIGTSRPPSADLRAALTGHIRTAVLDRNAARHISNHAAQLQQRHGDLIAITEPVYLHQSAKPVAAVVAYLAYSPISHAIASDTKSMQLILFAGLAALYLVLFRLVAGASRRLRRQAEANRELATHDNLTGLPNRALLRDRVEQAVRASRRSGRKVVLMLLDLDRFKEVNDTLGHHHGDRLLQQVGPRLQSALREADTVARLGGDEFVVLVPDVENAEDAVAVGEKLIEVLGAPFVIDDLTLDVETSIGIAYTPEHGDTFDDLLQRADIAMYVAKGSHKGVSVYTAALDAHSPSRLALLGELRRAIDDPEQLVCHYQPKVDVATRRTVGVEALARWQHPVHGTIPPAEFVPAAERTGLIRPLTSRVLHIALAQVRAWSDIGVEMPVSVNVSARCLLDTDFPTEVAELLAHYSVAPDMLEVELAEHTIMREPQRSLEVLTSLHHLGVKLSIDDFGAGYSSIAYLRRLPVNELKIDRTFVASVIDDVSDAAIVRATIELARDLNLCVVAEGVETQEVWDQLVRLGCDVAQGFYLTRALPADQLLDWVAPTRRGSAA